jgi:tRNA G10  N-methylase Trm11
MQPTLFDVGPRFANRDTKSVTFQGKLTQPIHRWYRLTPSFSPRLANDIADHFGLSADDFVLDPFSGVGTVPLCMKHRGIPACSVEINPYLHFVGTVKTRNYEDVPAIEKCFKEFLGEYRARLQDMPYESAPEGYLRDHAADIPGINFPERWWSPGNLAQLVCLRKLLNGYEAKPHHLDLLKMAALGILVPVSNAKHNHVSLTFDKKPLPTVEVADVLAKQLRDMAKDLHVMSHAPAADVMIYHGNSKELTKVLPAHAKVSAVITSPPYPNRFSYARETRPHLFFFDFITSARAVGQLETEAIGGTWGRATSVLARGVAPKNKLIQTLLDPYLRGIPQNGSLMAHYVVKYFNDMYDHAQQIAQVCKKSARLAYVIGNSKFYETPLASDEILASIFGHFGFQLESIERMRKRQSKSGLYEAVVFLRRG